MNHTATIERSEKTQVKISGMGPIVLDAGVGFRVWAPHADAVSVIGNFNDWDSQANPMTKEEGGTWVAMVEEAASGDEYKYLITR